MSMDSLGMNNDLTVGGRKFHVQTSYSESTNEINSQVFNEGVVISSRQIRLDSDRPREQIKERMEEIHQELTTEMEILYYICEKVKTVRHAASANKLGILFLQKNLIPEAIEQFNLASSIIVERKRKGRTVSIDLKTYVRSIDIQDGSPDGDADGDAGGDTNGDALKLRATVAITSSGSARPSEIVTALSGGKRTRATIRRERLGNSQGVPIMPSPQHVAEEFTREQLSTV